MSTLLDFSTRIELRPLATQVRSLHAAAGGCPFMLVGARARDLLLLPFPQIPITRATGDSDFVVAVESWDRYNALRDELIARHGFSSGNLYHRLRSGDGQIDLVPFDGLEDERREITWPPYKDTVMNLMGFREALCGAVTVPLPGGVEVLIASLPGVVMTKLLARPERKREKQQSDAQDIGLILSRYVAAGNRERLFAQNADLMQDEEFDEERAGAILLGRDILALLRKSPGQLESVRSRMQSILEPELDPDGPLLLAGDLQLPSGNAIELLSALRTGLTES